MLDNLNAKLHRWLGSRDVSALNQGDGTIGQSCAPTGHFTRDSALGSSWFLMGPWEYRKGKWGGSAVPTALLINVS